MPFGKLCAGGTTESKGLLEVRLFCVGVINAEGGRGAGDLKFCVNDDVTAATTPVVVSLSRRGCSSEPRICVKAGRGTVSYFGGGSGGGGGGAGGIGATEFWLILTLSYETVRMLIA